jgi:hypothetical protein
METTEIPSVVSFGEERYRAEVAVLPPSTQATRGAGASATSAWCGIVRQEAV